jgi:hypothetical protein
LYLNEIEAYVKYNYFHKEQTKKFQQKNPFRAENLYYNPDENCCYYPMGQKMSYIDKRKRTTATGHEQILKNRSLLKKKTMQNRRKLYLQTKLEI